MLDIKSHIRKSLWEEAAKKISFDSVEFSAYINNKKNYSLYNQIKGKSYKGLAYCNSNKYRKFNIFHVKTGTLLIHNILNITFAKSILLLLTLLYDWENDLNISSNKMDMLLYKLNYIQDNLHKFYELNKFDSELSQVL